jgi:hypothetical protein
VLADPEISTMLSAIVRGRVIATSHPTPFLLDFPQRWELVNAFFAPGTGPEMRENVLNLYHVRWIVIQSDQRFVLTGIESRVRVSLEWEGQLLLSSTGSSSRIGTDHQ